MTHFPNINSEDFSMCQLPPAATSPSHRGDAARMRSPCPPRPSRRRRGRSSRWSLQQQYRDLVRVATGVVGHLWKEISMFTIIIYHEWSNEYKFDQFLDEYVYLYIYRCVCVWGTPGVDGYLLWNYLHLLTACLNGYDVDVPFGFGISLGCIARNLFFGWGPMPILHAGKYFKCSGVIYYAFSPFLFERFCTGYHPHDLRKLFSFEITPWH